MHVIINIEISVSIRKFIRLFVLIKTFEISVSIRKYPQISIYFPDIRFSEYPYLIEKLNIRDIRIKSQIPSKNLDIRSVPMPIYIQQGKRDKRNLLVLKIFKSLIKCLCNVSFTWLQKASHVI